MTMSEMDVGSATECGRCGEPRQPDSTMAKDVTIHTSEMPVGNWYLCDYCQHVVGECLRGERDE